VSVDGILIVNKPPGLTSFSVVSRLRRASGEKRVGHAGTLDPDATGVLVVCFGQGTRMVEFLSGARKTYRSTIRLGTITDTLDAAGRVIESRDFSHITRKQAEMVIDTFKGPIEQVPPMYSAIRIEGKRLHTLAREGIDIPRKARKVHIYGIEMLEWHPPDVTLQVECSAGTYIRSLASDIGGLLGCGAHVHHLVRLRSEPFDIAGAVPLLEALQVFVQGDWRRMVQAIDVALLDHDAFLLGKDNEAMVANGRRIYLPVQEQEDATSKLCRAYSTDGRLLAVLRREEKDLWHPEKVFSSSLLEEHIIESCQAGS